MLLELPEAQVFTGIDYGDALAVMRALDPDEVINRGHVGVPYMQRWWIQKAAKIDDGSPIGNAFLHRFLRSDAEDMHDHPWPCATIVLHGRYLEATPEGDFWRDTGWRGERPSGAIHAIKEVEPGTVTIFITGKKDHEWGFMSPHGKVPWQAYSEYQATMTEHREAWYREASKRWPAEALSIIQRPPS